MSGPHEHRRKFCFCSPKHGEPSPTTSPARAAQERSCFSSASYTIPRRLSEQPTTSSRAAKADDSSASVSRRRNNHSEEQLECGSVGKESATGLTAAGASAVELPQYSGNSVSWSHHSRTDRTKESDDAPHYDRPKTQKGGSEVVCGDSAKINCKLNEIFKKRLREIDCSAEGDVDLKLVTYQEWVDMLLKVNDTVIRNMQDLETEVSEKLEMVHSKGSSQGVASGGGGGGELEKCRRDIATLLTVIQNGYRHNNWNISELHFETIDHADVFGERYKTDKSGADCETGSKKQPNTEPHFRALAVEVAEKHDEVRELRKQILCMEDEIQNAQRKIQLKDDVIRELRSDLRFANSKQLSDNSSSSTSTSTLTYTVMPPINFEAPNAASSARSAGESDARHSATTLLMSSGADAARCAAANVRPSDDYSLSMDERPATSKQRMIENELNALFGTAKDLKRQNYEAHRQRLSDIFHKSECEKMEAYRKLDFLRRQLADFEALRDPLTCYRVHCDSGFASKSEHDKDLKILDGVRIRICKLNECLFDLNKRVQQQEIEKHELNTKLQMEKKIMERNDEILKEIADLLSEMTGEQFSYAGAYAQQQNGNPFCDVIMQVQTMSMQREQQLCHKIAELEKTLTRKKGEIKKLERMPLDHEKSSNKNTTVFTTTLTTTTKTSLQREVVHQQHPQQQQQQQQQQHPQQHVKTSIRERQQRLELVDNRKYDTDDTQQSNDDNNNNDSNFQFFTWSW